MSDEPRLTIGNGATNPWASIPPGGKLAVSDAAIRLSPGVGARDLPETYTVVGGSAPTVTLTTHDGSVTTRADSALGRAFVAVNAERDALRATCAELLAACELAEELSAVSEVAEGATVTYDENGKPACHSWAANEALRREELLAVFRAVIAKAKGVHDRS